MYQYCYVLRINIAMLLCINIVRCYVLTLLSDIQYKHCYVVLVEPKIVGQSKATPDKGFAIIVKSLFSQVNEQLEGGLDNRKMLTNDDQGSLQDDRDNYHKFQCGSVIVDQTNRRFTALPQQVLRSPLSHQLNFLANNTTQSGDYQKYHSNQIFPITPLILIFTKYFLTNLPKLHKLHLTRNNKDNPKNHEVHMSGFWAYPSDWQ